MTGLELGISVAAIGLRDEPTGYAQNFNADVVATTKFPLKSGTVLDGEDGYTVFGKLAPAKLSVSRGNLPLGLAHNLVLKHDVPQDYSLTWDDVTFDASVKAYQLRKELEKGLAPDDEWSCN